MTWVVVALIPPIGHAAWALARSTGEVDSASPVAISLAAALLEVSLFVGLVFAVLAAARLNGTRLPLLTVVRPLAWAQAPAALYFLGLVPAITYFMPLLPLVLAARVGMSVRAAIRIARLSSAVAVTAVILGSAAGVLFGFAAASLMYS
ncbi:MAG: hypothetical protein ACRDM7_03960 [Thermoleophilaceae bacterium]